MPRWFSRSYKYYSEVKHKRKYPASFIKRQEHTQMLNDKDRAFFSILWPKQWIKTKEDLHHYRCVESTGKCKIRLFAWKTLLVSNLSFCLCLLLIFSVCSTSFYLWDHRNWLTGEYAVWWVYHSNLGWSPKNARYENVSCVKTLHYVWCTDHRDPLGTRTQDPYIKSVLLYQLS